MCRLPVKHLSKVQNVLWNYNTANSAIFGDRQLNLAMVSLLTGRQLCFRQYEYMTI